MSSIKAFAILTALIGMISMVNAAETNQAFYEMRTYHTAPGKLEALHARFREHTMGLFAKHGMTNVGYWVPVDNTNQVLIYILAYPSLEAREASWKAFQADPEWQAAKKASEVNGTLVTKVDSLYMVPTAFSPKIKIGKAKTPRPFELRKYEMRSADPNVYADKMKKLHLFGCWVPTDDKQGEMGKMIAMLVWRDKARMEADERLPENYDSIPLTPTDYSPTK